MLIHFTQEKHKRVDGDNDNAVTVISFHDQKAAEFKSQNTEVVVSKRFADLTGLTICIWVKTRDPGGKGALVSYSVHGEDNELALHDTTALQLTIKRETVATQVAVSDAKWNPVCVTWSACGGAWKIYRNGDFSNSGAALKPDAMLLGGGNLVLGQVKERTGGRYVPTLAFLGTLTEFNMWSRAITGLEISEVAGDCTI
ncbi:neuronal pentraxin-2-like [Ptychodera flava]|uniref:neuronal pentraxin-2-like n=1 Tax=Ptychodera flava TaxID=63121 RepID=UPI003969C648